MANHYLRAVCQLFAVTGLAALLLTSAWAAPAIPSGTSPQVATVSVSSGLTVMTDAQSPSGSHQDFGEVNTAATPRLEHLFTVRNDGTDPVTITRLQPSCGCTSAVLAGNGQLPAILKPGQKLPIEVHINLEPGLAGSFRKTVSVFTAGQAAPAAVLEMAATLNTLVVTATPAILDFGQAAYGKAISLPFTVQAKNGASPTALAASLACSSPDVMLRLMPAKIGENSGLISGLATLSAHSHLGPLQGEVLVLTPTGTSPLITLPIRGAVLGDIAASPAALSWEISAASLSTTRRIILTALTPEALHGLQVSCANRALTVHLENTTSSKTASIRVVLEPDVKHHVTARIIVTTANGQCLEIPVSIISEVTPNSGPSIATGSHGR